MTLTFVQVLRQLHPEKYLVITVCLHAIEVIQYRLTSQGQEIDADPFASVVPDGIRL
jgi:hypothetical protein